MQYTDLQIEEESAKRIADKTKSKRRYERLSRVSYMYYMSMVPRDSTLYPLIVEIDFFHCQWVERQKCLIFNQKSWTALSPLLVHRLIPAQYL